MQRIHRIARQQVEALGRVVRARDVGGDAGEVQRTAGGGSFQLDIKVDTLALLAVADPEIFLARDRFAGVVRLVLAVQRRAGQTDQLHIVTIQAEPQIQLGQVVAGEFQIRDRATLAAHQHQRVPTGGQSDAVDLNVFALADLFTVQNQFAVLLGGHNQLHRVGVEQQVGAVGRRIHEHGQRVFARQVILARDSFPRFAVFHPVEAGGQPAHLRPL